VGVLEVSRSDRFVSLSRMQLSPLNLETSRRYAACELTGGHRASGDTVQRQYPGRLMELQVCENCGVPMNAPANKRWGEQAI
jgi:hypothetical protein